MKECLLYPRKVDGPEPVVDVHEEEDDSGLEVAVDVLDIAT